MQTTDEQLSGAQTDQGSASDQVQNGDLEQQDNKDKVVSWDDHQRALNDLKRFKAEAKQRSQAERELAKRIEDMETSRLQEKEDFKSLAEKRAERIRELEGETESLKSGVFNSKKYDAVYAEAIRAGLRPEAESDLELLSMDSVAVEMTQSTNGNRRFQVSGAKDFVEELKRTRKHWFKNSNIPDVNPGGKAFSGSTGVVTAAEVNRLERVFNKSGKAEDKAAYQSALAEFRKSKLT